MQWERKSWKFKCFYSEQIATFAVVTFQFSFFSKLVKLLISRTFFYLTKERVEWKWRWLWLFRGAPLGADPVWRILSVSQRHCLRVCSHCHHHQHHYHQHKSLLIHYHHSLPFITRPYWEGPQWGITSFDNVGQAMLTVFQVFGNECLDLLIWRWWWNMHCITLDLLLQWYK